MDDTKVKDNEEATGAADEERGAASAQNDDKKNAAKDRVPAGARKQAEQPEEDEEDEDDEDDEEDEEEDEEEEDEEPARPVKTRAAQASKAAARDKAAPPKQATLAELPTSSRQNQIRVGLACVIGGLLSFWGAWNIYSDSIEKHHVNYYSHSAWLFVIAYFFVTMGAFNFLRLQMGPPDPKATPARKQVEAGFREPAHEPESPPLPRSLGLDRIGILLAALLCGPFYIVYWVKAGELWHQIYAQNNSGMWIIFALVLLSATAGAYHALRPPSEADEQAHRIPTRRVLMLMMLPFGMVFGMIWLASVYPPWP